MLKWIKSSSNTKPLEFDDTSCPYGVYFRRNIVETQEPIDETSKELVTVFRYDECFLFHEEYGQYLLDKENKRKERDNMINNYIWRIQRFDQQKTLGIPTTDSEETYKQLLEYIQYLRDFTKDLDFPYMDIPSFDEWKPVDKATGWGTIESGGANG